MLRASSCRVVGWLKGLPGNVRVVETGLCRVSSITPQTSPRRNGALGTLLLTVSFASSAKQAQSRKSAAPTRASRLKVASKSTPSPTKSSRAAVKAPVPSVESPFDEYTISPDEAAEVTAKLIADALASHETKPSVEVPNDIIFPSEIAKKQAQSASSTTLQPSDTPILKTRKPLVAVVGRPNVGKSTLFNRMLGQSKSIITDVAGTTRDRKYGVGEWNDYGMLLVDTGGMLGDSGDLSENIHQQALLAIEEADFVVYVVDVVEGLQPQERILARVLRQSGKPVVLVVNKCDNEQRAQQSGVFVQLGLGEPVTLSATHNLGVNELFERLVQNFKKDGFLPSFGEDALKRAEADEELRIAIVGVPNVGKSSLLNKILGHERSIVSPIPGTTTDPIDEKLLWEGKTPVTIIDTAGVRKKKAQADSIERLSALWSLKVIERSTVSLLVVDADKGPQEQDVKLANFVIENYKSCILVVNKWDLALDRTEFSRKNYEDHLRAKLKFHYYVPVMFSSALTGYNVTSIVDAAIQIATERSVKITTRRLYQIIQQSTLLLPPPSKGRFKLKFRFIAQTLIGGGPAFIFFVNKPELATESYMRFLETCIRREYPFTGTPLKLIVRKNDNIRPGSNTPGGKPKSKSHSETKEK